MIKFDKENDLQDLIDTLETLKETMGTSVEVRCNRTRIFAIEVDNERRIINFFSDRPKPKQFGNKNMGNPKRKPNRPQNKFGTRTLRTEKKEGSE